MRIFRPLQALEERALVPFCVGNVFSGPLGIDHLQVDVAYGSWVCRSQAQIKKAGPEEWFPWKCLSYKNAPSLFCLGQVT